MSISSLPVRLAYEDTSEVLVAIEFNPPGGTVMNSVVHFEMPFDDRDRMTKFYELAFGWRTQKLGKDIGSYVLATTPATDDRGLRRRGAINGGFFPKKPVGPISIRL